MAAEPLAIFGDPDAERAAAGSDPDLGAFMQGFWREYHTGGPRPLASALAAAGLAAVRGGQTWMSNRGAPALVFMSLAVRAHNEADPARAEELRALARGIERVYPDEVAAARAALAPEGEKAPPGTNP